MEPLIQAITLRTFDTMVTVESLVRSYTPKISPCKSISTALSPHNDALQRQYMIERIANTLSHALDSVVFEHLVNHPNVLHATNSLTFEQSVRIHPTDVYYPLKLFGKIELLHDPITSSKTIGAQYLDSSDLAILVNSKAILLKYNILNSDGIITLSYSIKDIMDPKITIIHGVN